MKTQKLQFTLASLLFKKKSKTNKKCHTVIITANRKIQI